MLTVKKGGYLLLEAMLASVIISSAILLKTQIELKYKRIDEVRLFTSNVTQIPYGIDKRVMLDGHTLSLSKTSFEGAADTIKNMLEESLIGSGSSACDGGWVPVDLANDSLNLISCNLFNPNRLAFNFDMDGSYELAPNGSVKTYSVVFFHKTSADFEKNFDIYPKLVNHARVMDSPQITGSHRYTLIDRRTDKELTPNECREATTDCGFKAEYTTNNIGMGEDVYLRVNGSNFMRGSIRFPESGSSPMLCRKVDSNGNHTTTDCGINFTDRVSGSNDLDFSSRSSFSEDFILANSTIKNGTSLLEAKCKSVTDTDVVSDVACGMTILKKSSSELITRAALSEISSGGTIYTHDGSKRTFEVDASTGNITTVGNAIIKNGAEVVNGFVAKNGNVAIHNGDGSSLSKGLNITSNEIRFTGDIPKLNDSDVFSKRYNYSGDLKQSQNELVTKGYLHSFNQIIDIRTDISSGQSHNLYRCPSGDYAKAVGFPAESTLLQSSKQIERICPFTANKGLPSVSVELSLVNNNDGTLSGTTKTSYSVNCRWEGDYAQAWFLNVNGGSYLPRFYLVSPKTHDNKVGNIEVKMRFTVIQYCGQGGLSNN